MNTEKWTASRVLVIKYDRDGRYHERLFRRTVLNNAFPGTSTRLETGLRKPS